MKYNFIFFNIFFFLSSKIIHYLCLTISFLTIKSISDCHLVNMLVQELLKLKIIKKNYYKKGKNMKRAYFFGHWFRKNIEKTRHGVQSTLLYCWVIIVEMIVTGFYIGTLYGTITVRRGNSVVSSGTYKFLCKKCNLLSKKFVRNPTSYIRN